MTPFYKWEHRQVQGEQATQARQRQGWDPTPNLLAQALSPGSLLGLLEKLPAAPHPSPAPPQPRQVDSLVPAWPTSRCVTLVNRPTSLGLRPAPHQGE